ncbi:uncharacterized protein LOC135108199 isoform X2 [Scylla paramamosain]|uniref:uncharacterized protein LOC135108199 isoform X2 n=1 Tax=Scylla paramamosain TaxID=85552 RepID=UPI003082C22B
MAGCTIRIIALLATILILVKGKALPDSKCNSKDFLVRHSIDVTPPIDQKFFAYITEWHQLVFVSEFVEMKYSQTRDGINLTNSKITHSKVRNGKTTEHPQDLPKSIPEGWNIIILTVAGRSLNVALVLSAGNVNLLNLTFDHDVKEMYIAGNFSLCPKGSPEWEVPKGKEVTVLLHPEDSVTEQWIEVIAGTSSSPFFRFPDKDKKFPVPANSTLKCRTILRGNYAILTVYKKNGSDYVEVESSVMPLTAPRTLVVGDALLARLLSHFLAPPADLPTCTSYLWLLSVFGVVIVIVPIYTLKKKCNKNTNDDSEAADVNDNAQMPLMTQNKEITKNLLILVGPNCMRSLVNILNKHCQQAAPRINVTVHAVRTNNGQEGPRQLDFIPSDHNSVPLMEHQPHEGPALIELTGRMKQEDWEALLQDVTALIK